MSFPRGKKAEELLLRCARRLAAVVPTSPMHPLGITMQLLDTRRGAQHFTFKHHREYQQVQFKFLDAVESMDPNNIVVGCEIGLSLLLPPAFLQPLARAGEVGWCIPVLIFCQSHFEQ